VVRTTLAKEDPALFKPTIFPVAGSRATCPEVHILAVEDHPL
jgi:hypothetical protein